MLTLRKNLLAVVFAATFLLTALPNATPVWAVTPEIISFSASPPSPVMVGTEVALTAEVSGGGIIVDQISLGAPISSTSSEMLGQTFKPASNNLAAVDLNLATDWYHYVNQLTVTITLKIFDNYWWAEGANLLGSSTVQTNTLLPVGIVDPFTAVHFEFDEPIPVTPEQVYVMQVTREGVVYWNSNSNLYPRGRAIIFGIPQPYQDFAFKTYTRTDPQIRFSTDGGDNWSEWSYENTFSWTTDEQDIGTNILLAQASDGVNQVTSDPIFYEVLPTIPWAIEDIKQNVVKKGIQISLTAKLEKAVKALDEGNFEIFEKILNAFINGAEAQKGRMIDEGYATLLVDWATGWMQLLGQA